MGSYGIGPGRVLACIVQAHHDASGMRWPISVAPYHLALASLGGARSPEVVKAADGIYERLRNAGTEVLYDDREESAGVKFHDADLLGLPLRLTVGGKGLARGAVELKVRRTGEVREVALEQLLPCLQRAIEAEWQALQAVGNEQEPSSS